MPHADAGLTPPPRGALIYALAEPAGEPVCYVGQTRRPAERLLGHLSAGRLWLAAIAHRPPESSPQLPLKLPSPLRRATWCARPPSEPRLLEEWLARHVYERSRPAMRVVERVSCGRDCGCSFVTECRRARAREAAWIDHYLRAGQPVLNRTLPRDGGQSSTANR